MEWACALEQPPRIAQSWIGHRHPALHLNYRLERHWQLVVYQHGGLLSAQHRSASITTELTPGMVSIFPPGTSSQYRLKERGVYSVVHFALPESGPQRLPAIARPSDAGTAFISRFDQALGVWTGQPCHGEALLWALLWELTALPNSVLNRGSRVVASARELIELHLETPLSVHSLARRCGVSPAHLRRLFQAETGLSVKGWMQSRRLTRAKHLLRHSDMPIRVVAESIGMPDLQGFNKAVRRQFGLSPRALRTAPAPGIG